MINVYGSHLVARSSFSLVLKRGKRSAQKGISANKLVYRSSQRRRGQRWGGSRKSSTGLLLILWAAHWSFSNHSAKY